MEMSKKEQYRITRCRSLLAGFKLARLPSKVMDDIQGACVRSLGCGSASQPAGSAAGQPRLPGDSADGRTDGRAGRERFHALGGSHKQPITGRFLGERRLPDAPSNGEPLAACQPGVKKSCSFPPHTPRFSSPLFRGSQSCACVSALVPVGAGEAYRQSRRRVAAANVSFILPRRCLISVV